MTISRTFAPSTPSGIFSHASIIGNGHALAKRSLATYSDVADSIKYPNQNSWP